MKSSREKNKGPGQQWGGGRRACYVTPGLCFEFEGERKERQIKSIERNKIYHKSVRTMSERYNMPGTGLPPRKLTVAVDRLV